MPGTTPRHSADQPPHSTKSVAAATTDLLWSVALASTRASFAATARGLALWSQMLRPPIGPWSLVASALISDPNTSIGASVASTEAATASSAPAQGIAGDIPQANAPAEEAAPFASYRSSGGHAAAQVVTPD